MYNPACMNPMQGCSYITHPRDVWHLLTSDFGQEAASCFGAINAMDIHPLCL